MKFLVELSAVASILLMWLCPVESNSYYRFETDTLHYVRAEVLEILSEELEDSSLGTKQQLGCQELLVRLADGEEVYLTNYLTETHNVLAVEGARVIICADVPVNAEPYYTVYNYDRSGAIAGLIICFIPVSYTHLDVYKRQVSEIAETWWTAST